MPVTFETVANTKRVAEIVLLMEGLYREDPPSFKEMDPGKFGTTVSHLVANPSEGTIILITEEEAILGYAILIPYWSNELGGRIVFLDELFVIPTFRGRGLARLFFHHIRETRPYQATFCMLEVSESNNRAQNLYLELGFSFRSNRLMACSWACSFPKVSSSIED